MSIRKRAPQTTKSKVPRKISDFDPTPSSHLTTSDISSTPLYDIDYPSVSREEDDRIEQTIKLTAKKVVFDKKTLPTFDIEFGSWFRRNVRWILPSVTVPVFAITLYSLINFMLFLDLNKRVYNHVSGECSFLPGVEFGASDVAWMDNRTVIMTSGTNLNNVTNATNGALVMWRIDGHETFRLELRSSTKKPTAFNPYGLSYYFDPKRGGIFAVVNLQSRADTIELLQIDSTQPRYLKRIRRPIQSALFTSLRDVQLLGRGDRFYATNAFRSRRYPFQLAEFVCHRLTGGSLVYFDGQKVKSLLSELPTPTGLAYDPSRRLIFISMMSADRIDVFRQQNNDDERLLKVEEITVHSAPHFFVLEPQMKSLVVAAHPLKLRHLLYESNSEVYYAPSQVLRFRRVKKGDWRATQLYVNDGATISGATVAIRLPDKQIGIGNSKSGLLRCGLTSV
ncbi:Paraoxonase [Aphelenchoides besseyi]|nr:Paraoxonase [Aphelenchoides besseyi]KAI6211583.1 Paraoxonase [Aphelenchoides besseyi]